MAAGAGYSIDWYRVPVPCEELKKLTARSDWKASLQTVGFLGWLDDPVHYKSSHTLHHLYTLHPPKDREVRLPIRLRLWQYVRVAIIDPIALFNGIKNVAINAFGGYVDDWQKGIAEENGERTKRALARFARAHLVIHSTIIAIAAVNGTRQLAILTTFASFYGRWLQFLCNESQHVGLIDNVPDFRLCCRTFTLNPLVRFLYRNMNFHTEHHMYAVVPCYHLTKLHRSIPHELPPYTHGLTATWRQIIGILKKQQQNPGYEYISELPNQASQLLNPRWYASFHSLVSSLPPRARCVAGDSPYLPVVMTSGLVHSGADV